MNRITIDRGLKCNSTKYRAVFPSYGSFSRTSSVFWKKLHKGKDILNNFSSQSRFLNLQKVPKITNSIKMSTKLG